MRLIALRSGALIIAALTSAACGGGGGGGGNSGTGSGGGGSNSGGSGPRLSLSTNQLNFAAAAAGPVSPQDISGTISGTPQAVYVTIAHTTNGIASVSQPVISSDRATSRVTPQVPSTLAEGIYQDTITVTACPTPTCTTQFAGSPQTINVTYVVGIVTNTASISAQAIEARSPAPQNLDVRYFGGSDPWNVLTTYSSGSDWLTIQQSSKTELPASTSVSFAALPAGEYAASVRLSVAQNTPRAAIRDIPVSYSVLPLLSIAPPTPFVLRDAQQTEIQTREVVVGTRDSTRPTGWQARLESSTPWLVLSAAAGDASKGDAFRVQLVSSEVEKLRNGTPTTNVIVTPADPGATPVIVPVSIDLDRTHVSTVAPYVAGANREGLVSIRGHHFDADAISSVMFGSTPSAAPIEVVSDQRIVATHPALPAGRYPVTLLMHSGAASTTSAELVVQDSMNYAGATNIVAGPPSVQANTVFDPERGACYFFETTGITAVKREPSGWVLHKHPFPAPFTEMGRASLSTDGRELFLSADSRFIVHFDPATMQETRRYDTAARQMRSSPGDQARALEGNEVGYEFDRTLRRYDPARNADFEYAKTTNDSSFYYSRIGNRVVFGFSSSTTSGSSSNLLIADPLGGGAVPFFSAPMTFRTLLSTTLADRWALVGEWSHSFNEVILTDARGTETGRFGAQVLSAALSADGNRFIYVGPSGRTSAWDPKIRIMDLTAMGAGVTPPETHSLPIPERYLYGPIFLTPDESELVFCNQDRITAVTLPSS